MILYKSRIECRLKSMSAQHFFADDASNDFAHRLLEQTAQQKVPLPLHHTIIHWHHLFSVELSRWLSRRLSCNHHRVCRISRDNGILCGSPRAMVVVWTILHLFQRNCHHVHYFDTPVGAALGSKFSHVATNWTQWHYVLSKRCSSWKHGHECGV